MQAWAERLTHGIGERMRQVRESRGRMSAQALSDRTADLGHRIPRGSISEYETGARRSMPVSDLLVLSAALEVSPLDLIVPGLPDGEVEVLPDVVTRASTAADWIGRGLGFATGERRAFHLSSDTEFGAVRRLLERREELTSSKLAQMSGHRSDVHRSNLEYEIREEENYLEDSPGRIVKRWTDRPADGTG